MTMADKVIGLKPKKEWFRMIRKLFSSVTHEAVNQAVLGACRLCSTGGLCEQVRAMSISSDLDIAEIIPGEGNGLNDLQRSPLALCFCGCLLQTSSSLDGKSLILSVSPHIFCSPGLWSLLFISPKCFTVATLLSWSVILRIIRL